MFDCIAYAHHLALRRAEVEVAMEQYNAERKDPEVAEIPRQPNARERALHEVTHIPFRPWCQHCVAARSLVIIMLAWFRLTFSSVDTWARYVHAEPLKTRNKRNVGEAMARFLGNLGYSEDVEVAVDNEPVLVAGMEFCKEVRVRTGLSTVVTTNRNYDKSRTSPAERMIQTVRNLQKTLIYQLETEIKAKILTGNCLR